MTPLQQSLAATYLGLIATLPLFALHVLPGGVSLPLVFMLAAATLVGTRAAFTLRVPAVFSRLDQILFLYLCAALASMIGTANEESLFAFAKSITYFLAYLGLKGALAELSVQQIERVTRRGVLLGTALFTALAVFALSRTDSLGLIRHGLQYHEVTLRVFAAIDEVFGQGRESFLSVHVMRNAVGEAFAFYAITGLVLGFRSRLVSIAVATANFLFTLAMFSRRALLAICFGTVLGGLRPGSTLRMPLALATLFLALSLFGALTTGEVRLMDFSDEARTSQYAEALGRFASSPLFGDGYAAKLSDGRYVHNFVLAGALMMGIPGLLATAAVFAAVCLQLFHGLRRQSASWTHPLLLIPLLGMAVGSTVEGIFTVTGWATLAVHDVCLRKRGAPSRGCPDAQRGAPVAALDGAGSTA